MSKIDYIWSVLCESSVIDSETNNISLNNVIEEVKISAPKGKMLSTLTGTPTSVPIKCELISMWEKNTTDKEVYLNAKLSLLDPQKKELFKNLPIELKFSKGIERLRSRIRFNNLPITTPGIYRFNLYTQEGKELILVGGINLNIKFAL